MWKATATLDKKQLVHITPSKDEDWDSDPDFVNEISEKDQRWGKQKTIQENPKSNPVEMNGNRLFHVRITTTSCICP
jgi:cortactin